MLNSDLIAAKLEAAYASAFDASPAMNANLANMAKLGVNAFNPAAKDPAREPSANFNFLMQRDVG